MFNGAAEDSARSLESLVNDAVVSELRGDDLLLPSAAAVAPSSTGLKSATEATPSVAAETKTTTTESTSSAPPTKNEWSAADDAKLVEIVTAAGTDVDWGRIGVLMSRDAADCGLRWFTHCKGQHEQQEQAGEAQTVERATAASAAPVTTSNAPPASEAGFAPPALPAFAPALAAPETEIKSSSSDIAPASVVGDAAVATEATAAPEQPAPTVEASSSIAEGRPRRTSVIERRASMDVNEGSRGGNKWTEADDQKLDDAFGMYGPSWEKVASVVGSGRTGRACKDRMARRVSQREAEVDLTTATRPSKRRISTAAPVEEAEEEGQDPIAPVPSAFDRRPSPFADLDDDEDDPSMHRIVRVRTPSPPAKIIGKKLGKHARAPPVTAEVGRSTASTTASRVPVTAAPLRTATKAESEDGLDAAKGSAVGNGASAPTPPSRVGPLFLPNVQLVANPPIPFPKHTIIRGRRTKAADEMEGKLLSKTGKIKKVHICPAENCNAAFKRSEHLKRHYKAVHIGAKPFPCDAEGCDKQFSRKDNLHQHMIFVHSLKPVRDDTTFIGPPASVVPVAAQDVSSSRSVRELSEAVGSDDGASSANGSSAAEASSSSKGGGSGATANRSRLPAVIRYEHIAEEDKNRRRKISRKSDGSPYPSSPRAGSVSSGKHAAVPKDEEEEDEIEDEPVPQSVVEEEKAEREVEASHAAAAAATEPPTTGGARTLASSRLRGGMRGGLGDRFRQGRGGGIAPPPTSAPAVPVATTSKRGGVSTIKKARGGRASIAGASRRKSTQDDVSELAPAAAIVVHEAPSLGFAPPRSSPKFTTLPIPSAAKHARDDDAEDSMPPAAKRSRDEQVDEARIMAAVAESAERGMAM